MPIAKKKRKTTKRKTTKGRRARAKKVIDRPGERDLSPPLGEAKATVLQHLSVARPYQWTDAYKEGDAISHPSFGFGEVRRVLSERKIEVSFEDRTCLLRHTCMTSQIAV